MEEKFDLCCRPGDNTDVILFMSAGFKFQWWWLYIGKRAASGMSFTRLHCHLLSCEKRSVSLRCADSNSHWFVLYYYAAIKLCRRNPSSTPLWYNRKRCRFQTIHILLMRKTLAMIRSITWLLIRGTWDLHNVVGSLAPTIPSDSQNKDTYFGMRRFFNVLIK